MSGDDPTARGRRSMQCSYCGRPSVELRRTGRDSKREPWGFACGGCYEILRAPSVTRASTRTFPSYPGNPARWENAARVMEGA